MPFVVDCSVSLGWCFHDEQTDETTRLLERAAADGALAPEIWPLEMLNAMLVAVRRQRIDDADFQRYVSLIPGLGVSIDRQPDGWPVSGIADLASTQGLTAYDASYLQLAIDRGLPLATRDRALARAARQVGVAVLGGG